ncbi:MAG: POTRA domain-containing protein [Halioglobus sp.]
MQRSKVGNLVYAIPRARFRSTAFLVVTSLLIFAQATYAQRIPGTIRPGQIERQFEGRKSPQAVEPAQKGRKEMPLPQTPAGADEIRLFVKDIQLDGATVYATGDLRHLYQEQLGKELTLADIYAIANSVTRKYRGDGYVISQVMVPEQDVEGGVVRLQVLEGFIDKVDVRGELVDGSDYVQRLLDHITQEKPVHIQTVERYMLLVNDIDGIYAQSTLVPGDQLGSSTLVVDVSRDTFDALVGIDNRGSDFLGPVRGRLEMDFNTLFSSYSSLGAFVSSTGNDELNFGSLTFQSRLGDNGMRLMANGSIVRSEPDQGVQLRGLENNSESGLIALSYPLVRTRSHNVTLNGQFSYYDGDVDLLGIKIGEDRVRSLRLGLTWDLFDQYGGVNIVDASLSQGLDILDASDPDDDIVSRLDADVEFTKANLYAARLQSVTTNFTVLAALDGQYAFDTLLSSEGYGYGGELFGRGYDPSELFGDSGAGFKLELRYLLNSGGWISKAEPYTFWDIGYVRNKTQVFGQDRSESAASAGGGMRLNLGNSIAGYVEIAKPLTREVLAEGNKDARIYGAVSYRF